MDNSNDKVVQHQHKHVNHLQAYVSERLGLKFELCIKSYFEGVLDVTDNYEVYGYVDMYEVLHYQYDSKRQFVNKETGEILIEVGIVDMSNIYWKECWREED